MRILSQEAYKASELGRCLTCIIKEKGLCNALTNEQLLRFKQIARKRVYEAGDIILYGEEKVSFVAGVVSGIVKMSKILIDGRQQIIGLLFPSDNLGRVFGQKNLYFAEAATKVELCCFEQTGFEEMLEDFPELKQRLLLQTLDDLDAAREWMTLLGRKTAKEKVASFFLLIARRTSIEKKAHQSYDIFEMNLKRCEIGDYLGLTYETVCRQIRWLTENDITEWPSKRSFRVKDIHKLIEIAK